jgi:hypothetical protein
MPSTQKEPNTFHKKKTRSRVAIQESKKGDSKLITHPSVFERLPTEILCEIATIYLSDTNDLKNITQICRRLRQIVLKMSSIWRRISLLSADSPGYGYEDVRQSHFWINGALLSLNRVTYSVRRKSKLRSYLNKRELAHSI